MSSLSSRVSDSHGISSLAAAGTLQVPPIGAPYNPPIGAVAMALQVLGEGSSPQMLARAREVVSVPQVPSGGASNNPPIGATVRRILGERCSPQMLARTRGVDSVPQVPNEGVSNNPPIEATARQVLEEGSSIQMFARTQAAVNVPQVPSGGASSNPPIGATARQVLEEGSFMQMFARAQTVVNVPQVPHVGDPNHQPTLAAAAAAASTFASLFMREAIVSSAQLVANARVEEQVAAHEWGAAPQVPSGSPNSPSKAAEVSAFQFLESALPSMRMLAQAEERESFDRTRVAEPQVPNVGAPNSQPTQVNSQF